MSLSTIILTKNSEGEIERCIKSVLFSDEIIVVDDESEDQTREIAEKLGEKVIKNSLSGDFASQRNFGLGNVHGDWVLFVDSDEVVSESLAKEIQNKFKKNKYDGYMLKRQDTMWGKKIKYGENGSVWLLRLARKNSGEWIGKVHEEWQVSGKIDKLKNSLDHFPHPTIAEFLEDINSYTSIRAKELYKKGIKVKWYDLILYPKAKFMQNYFLKLGFFDGTRGFMLAIIMSMHSFLVRGKLWQLQKKRLTTILLINWFVFILVNYLIFLLCKGNICLR